MYLFRISALVASIAGFPAFSYAANSPPFITGSCKIENTNKCSLQTRVESRNVAIQGIRVLANEQPIFEWQNDSANPSTVSGTYIYSENFSQAGARCGRQYKLQFYLKSTDDQAFKKVAETLPIQCPSKIPN